VELTAEIADGWLPMLFIPERAKEVWGAAMSAGAAKRSSNLGELMISAGGLLAIGEGHDVIALRDLQRSMVALYVGAWVRRAEFLQRRCRALRLREGSSDHSGSLPRGKEERGRGGGGRLSS